MIEMPLAAASNGILAKELVVFMSSSEPFTSLQGIVVNESSKCLFDLCYSLVTGTRLAHSAA